MALPETVIPDTLPQIPPEHQGLYDHLCEGLRHRRDHVTLRTLLIDVKTILGVPKDDAPWQPLPAEQFDQARALLENLTADTFSAPWIPELLYSLGFSKETVLAETNPQPLDYAIVSGRFLQDPLFFDLANELTSQGHSVAVLNPVGTYNDGQPRIMGLSTLLRPVNHLVILASTQTQRGGSVEILEDVIRTFKNPEVAQQVKTVTIAIPMFGGSRGHRISQAQNMGFEIFEAESAAKDIIHTLQHLIISLKDKDGLDDTHIPKFQFVSIDIHNQDQPGSTFVSRNFEFISASPAKEFAREIYHQLSSRQLLHHALKVFVPDTGAIPRTEDLVIELLHHPQNHLQSIDIVYVEKVRKVAGKVSAAWVEKVERWTLNANGSVAKTPIEAPTPDHPSPEPCIIIGTDDMGDTLGTGANDIKLVQAHFPNQVFTIFSFTHPVLSQGPENLNQVDADLILLGNTLITDALEQAIQNGHIRPQVQTINLAPTLARALESPD